MKRKTEAFWRRKIINDTPPDVNPKSTGNGKIAPALA
jgi:hypothetical protein